jgi:hypothetical protein
VSADNHRLAPAEPIPWRDVARVSALLQELLDHPKGNPEPMSNFDARTLVIVIGSKDSFTQIQRECSHVPTLPHPFNNGYNIN